MRGVGKTYDTGTRALAQVDLDVRHGEFLTLVGPSGCGKSTLLSLIAGLDPPNGRDAALVGRPTSRTPAAPAGESASCSSRRR